MAGFAVPRKSLLIFRCLRIIIKQSIMRSMGKTASVGNSKYTLIKRLCLKSFYILNKILHFLRNRKLVEHCSSEQAKVLYPLQNNALKKELQEGLDVMNVKVGKSLGLLFIFIFALSAINMVHAFGVTATIPVGKAPSSGAYDSAKGEIFVTNAQDGTVSVISDGTNSVVDTITVGSYPYGSAYDSSKGEIFVVDALSDNVSVISDSSNTVIATIPVGSYPNLCVYDSAKGEIFVTNTDDNNVSVISDSTNAVVTTIPVGTAPFGIAYDSAKGEIFVSNDDSQSISVISDSNNAVIATVPVPSCQFVTYDSARGEVFVSDFESNSVSIISDSTNAVVATVGNLGDGQIEGSAYDSGKSEIFVALHQSDRVAVISDSTNKVVADITVGTLPWGVIYDSGTSALYVTNGNGADVSVLSDASSTSATSSPSSSGGFDWLVIVVIVIIILLILIFLVWYMRQRKLVVKVQDSQTMSPVPGANVSASGPETLSGATESNGQVVFSNPKKGDYTISASATGYITSMPSSVSVKNKTTFVVKLDSNMPKTQAGAFSNTNPGMSKGNDNASDSTSKASSSVSNHVAPELNNQTQQAQMQANQNKEQESVPVSTAQTPQNMSSSTGQQRSSGQQGVKAERFRQLVRIFLAKGATSPEKALTAEQLGLPQRFEEYMENRKGQTKIFVESNGKYYLDQKALSELRQQRANRESANIQ